MEKWNKNVKEIIKQKKICFNIKYQTKNTRNSNVNKNYKASLHSVIFLMLVHHISSKTKHKNIDTNEM